MHPDDLERLADLMVDRLADRFVELGEGRPQSSLVDAAAIARLTGLSRETIYARALELGVVRIGSGPRPRLRFDPKRVMEILAADAASEPGCQPATKRRRRRPGTVSAELLPIRGPEA
jgi:hypothetical protein